MPLLTPAALVFSELVIEVFRVNGLALEAGDRLTRPAALTSARWQVLGVIDHAPATVADVARTMGLRRQSVQQTAEALVADGLATFMDNPRHRRAKLLDPTESGRRALAETERAHALWADALAAALEPSQIEAATAALRTLSTALQPEGSR